MEMFCFGVLGGVVLALIVMAVLCWADEDIRDGDRDNNPSADDPGGECNGMDRDIPDDEEIEVVLRWLRMCASKREKKVIDYLLEKEGMS